MCFPCMCVDAWLLQRPEEGARSPGTGVKDGCVGTEPGSSSRTASARNCPAIPPASKKTLFKRQKCLETEKMVPWARTLALKARNSEFKSPAPV